MVDRWSILDDATALLVRYKGLVLPALVAGMLLVILVPLPPALVDLLLSANIALAAVLLLLTLYVRSPLELSVFPSMLLVTTLLRLVLNVATTRLILTAGRAGGDVAEAQWAAGHVLWGFSQFVTSGSLPVGLILFGMLVIIQFVVVTKGAARVSEVAARFVLDAMPGKQMAIDSDLNSRLIDEAEARRRRTEVAREADFYGAMDGASKFLRGDAIAALVIIVVNLLGGMYVGLVQYGWSFQETVSLFTRLTIGDGLVTQVPAFLISISAGMIVTRSAGKNTLGEEIIGQMTARPIALVVAGAFLAILALTPLPALPLGVLGAGCVGLAALLTRRRRAAGVSAPAPTKPAPQAGRDVQPLLEVEPLKVELGYALVSLVDSAAGGGLLDKIAGLRREIASKLGLVVPPIRISDSMRGESRRYTILLRGVEVATGKLMPRRVLAIGEASDLRFAGAEPTQEPTFGTPAAWIEPGDRGRAEARGCTVVEPDVVLTTHLGETIRRHASELLNRQQVVGLLENLRKRSPELVAEATGTLGISRIQKVLRGLLHERVSIRDLEAILEALCEMGLDIEDVEGLTEHVRGALWRLLSQQHTGEDGKLWCLCLDADLEQRLGTYVAEPGRGGDAAVPGELRREIREIVQEGASRLKERGHQPVVLCAPHVRAALRDTVATVSPELAVLGYNEVDADRVQTLGTSGAEI
jgi:flagellar biosynthesis protein FlhA